jgi:hypothetical protein
MIQKTIQTKKRLADTDDEKAIKKGLVKSTNP